MIKFFCLFLQILLTIWEIEALGQDGERQSFYGRVVNVEMPHDTIYFLKPRHIDSNYYDFDEKKAAVNSNTFLLEATISYPKPFTVIFGSEKEERLGRYGRFFLDSTGKEILVDYKNESCGFTDGNVDKEFRESFLPFLFKKNENDCDSAVYEDLLFDSDETFDQRLLDYTYSYPESYLALWGLVERYSLFGHSELREKTLQQFGDTLRKSNVWQQIFSDIGSAKLKVKEKFPDVAFKDTGLASAKINVQQKKYVLLDFWFHNCIPCIQGFPKLKSLYEKYEGSGLGIISVSIDQTKNISKWLDRISTEKLPWPQLIDENATYAKSAKILFFPTYVLLDDKGVVVKRNGRIEEIEAFLEENM